MAINYYGIQEALFNLIKDGTYTNAPEKVFIEAMERETSFDNMPLVNIRLVDGTIEIRSLPNGYFFELNFEIDVVSFNLNHFKEAATLRDTLMKEIQDLVISNPRFHADLLTAHIMPNIQFSAGTPEGAGGHIAAGTLSVTAEAYVDAT